MIIANPIYDVVFKRLMENKQVAKFFIGTLLEQTVERLEVCQQEFIYDNVEKPLLLPLSLLRLDFIATVCTQEGELKKVLIEIQKVRNFPDLMRFRNYLAEQYKKQDRINGEEVALPITTIYILGFNLPEIETACLKVSREYQDMISRKTIHAKSDFVEKLTHDAYIVQTCRIAPRYQTRLEKLLSIFEQSNFVEDNNECYKYYDSAQIIESSDEELQEMTDILRYVASTDKERKEIENEKEALRLVKFYFGTQDKKIAAKEKIIAEKEETIAEQSKRIAELERLLNEKK